MDKTLCYWLEPTELVQLNLRRYVTGKTGGYCPVSGMEYHNAVVSIGTALKSDHPCVSNIHKFDRTDPRWPSHCGCGYKFRDCEIWQFHPKDLWKRADTGELVTQDTAAPGGMLHASWYTDFDDDDLSCYRNGPDKVCLLVKLPNDVWFCADGPATNANGIMPNSKWTRTGTIPKVTVSPSINHPTWHGWLKNGILSLDGATE